MNDELSLEVDRTGVEHVLVVVVVVVVVSECVVRLVGRTEVIMEVSTFDLEFSE